MKRRLIWMVGAPALLVTLGFFSRPITVLAQAGKSTLVRSVGEPGREPYMETIGYVPGSTSSPCCGAPTFPAGPLGVALDNCNITFSAVPAGKRLIITDIYSRLSITTPQPTGFSAEGNLGVNA